MPRLALLIAVIVVLLVPDSAQAGRVRNHRWDDSKVIIVENRMGPDWNEAVAFNFSNWKKLFPRLKFRVVNKPGKPCAREDGKIIICKLAPNPNRLAYASWYPDGREIVAAQIFITPKSGINKEPWNEHRIMSDMVMLCHETAHALGLNHNPNTETSCVAHVSSRITPGSYDRNSLLILYKKKGAKWP